MKSEVSEKKNLLVEFRRKSQMEGMNFLVYLHLHLGDTQMHMKLFEPNLF